MRTRTSTKLLAVATVSIVFAKPLPAQYPADAMEKMFETFAEKSGPFAPLMGKLSPEQKRKIEAIPVSIKDEEALGERVLDAFQDRLSSNKIGMTIRGQDIQYLEELAGTIKPFMKNAKRYGKLDIRIFETASSDAYSVPGGHLLISRGLLDNCGNEAALVGVVAHELSHLDHGHQLLPLKQSKLTRQPLDFKDQMMTLSLIARPFHPEQESEADLDATTWMMKAGYQPRELARLLTSWDQQQSQSMPWMQFIPGFVKSHPNPGKRAQEVLMRSEKIRNQFPNAQYVGTSNLQQRIPKSKQSFDAK